MKTITNEIIGIAGNLNVLFYNVEIKTWGHKQVRGVPFMISDQFKTDAQFYM